MQEQTQVFNRDCLKTRQKRYTSQFLENNFLHEHAARLIAERLEDITYTFCNNLYIGRTIPAHILQQYVGQTSNSTCINMGLLNERNNAGFSVVADEELLPFSDHKLDLIIANLNLHQTNDLPGTLIQIRRALKPDGLFIAALFGGETLWELRQSLNYADDLISGGMTPRVHPFADKQQMGALMQRAGFALPVVDSEFVTVTYPDIFKLMSDLRKIGETNIINNRLKTFTRRQLFQEAAKYYADHFSDEEGKILATFEMIFLIGWGPAETQQKPLKPGSAKVRLADALGTTEIGTGEKAAQ